MVTLSFKFWRHGGHSYIKICKTWLLRWGSCLWRNRKIWLFWVFSLPCDMAADAHVPSSAGKGSVSRMKAKFLAECWQLVITDSGFFLLSCSWKDFQMIVISFLKWLGEGSGFVPSGFGERRDTLLFVCAEFTIISLSRSDFLNVSKIIKLPRSERGCEEKERWGERRKEMLVKQVEVFLVLGGVFILQQLFLVRRGGCGEGGVTAGVCNRVWHLLSHVARRNCTSASSLSF